MIRVSPLLSPRATARPVAPARARRTHAVRATALGLTALGVTALAAVLPGQAAGADTLIQDGTVPGPGLAAWQSLALYLGAPLLLAVVITVLVMAPSWVRGPRYRPSLTWFAAPVWLGAPEGEHLAGAADAEGAGHTPTTVDAGGSSARW